MPVEWFALSSGARIAMDSGTENMDWVAAALRRIIEFTQHGGEINVVVTGINVGAQPYWNAEATMLMHTRGILVMTPESAMVLTGKQALDFAGGVSAEDNFGIGGYDRIMGPNGQAQYWAPDLAGACSVLLRYYDHAYVAPGERFPRRAETPRRARARRPRRRRTRAPGSELATVGEIFSDETNPGRKQAFDIRSVMRAVVDSDHRPLERWERMRDAEAAVVWDAHLGGWPTTVIGIESHPIDRFGPDARRRPVAVDVGHAVPEVLEEGRARDQLQRRPPAAGRAGQPGGLRRLARVDAPVAARVRRRDRPRDRQLPRPDRVLRHLPLPRRRVRGLLAAPERGLRGDRRRGRARVRDRRLRGGRRGVHARRQRRDALRRARRRAGGAHRGRRGAPRRAACAPSSRRCWRPCARRRWASWPRSSTRSTRSSARSRSARCRASSPPATCGPTWSTRSSAAWRRPPTAETPRRLITAGVASGGRSSVSAARTSKSRAGGDRAAGPGTASLVAVGAALGGGEDLERHPREVGERLVAVLARAEVDLRHPLEADGAAARRSASRSRCRSRRGRGAAPAARASAATSPASGCRKPASSGKCRLR